MMFEQRAKRSEVREEALQYLIEAVLDRSDVATAIAELEQKGLVERKPDPANRRRNIVTLTKDGARALAALDSVLDGIQDRVMAPLSPRERKNLVALLRKLAAESPPPALDAGGTAPL